MGWLPALPEEQRSNPLGDELSPVRVWPCRRVPESCSELVLPNASALPNGPWMCKQRRLVSVSAFLRMFPLLQLSLPRISGCPCWLSPGSTPRASRAADGSLDRLKPFRRRPVPSPCLTANSWLGGSESQLPWLGNEPGALRGGLDPTFRQRRLSPSLPAGPGAGRCRGAPSPAAPQARPGPGVEGERLPARPVQ